MVEEGGHGLCRKNGANVCFHWFACVAFLYVFVFVCVYFCVCVLLFMSAKLRCVFSTDRGSRVLSSDNSFYLTFFVL